VERLSKGWQEQFGKKEVANVAFDHLQGGGRFVVGVVQSSFALGMQEESEFHCHRAGARVGSSQQITQRCNEKDGRKGLCAPGNGVLVSSLCLGNQIIETMEEGGFVLGQSLVASFTPWWRNSLSALGISGSRSRR